MDEPFEVDGVRYRYRTVSTEGGRVTQILQEVDQDGYDVGDAWAEQNCACCPVHGPFARRSPDHRPRPA